MSSRHDQRQSFLNHDGQSSLNEELNEERQSSGKTDRLIATGAVTFVAAVCVIAGGGTAIPMGVIAGGGTATLGQNIGMIPLGIIGVHNYLNYYHEMKKK
eukprot:264516_1